MAWFGLGRKRAEIAELREQLNSRAIGGVPWVDNNPAVPFGSGGPAHPSRIAQGVDGALSLAPIYGACRVLADGVASLPIQVYIGAHSQTQATRWNGPSLFDKPSAFPHTTTYDWLFQAMTSLVLEGNAFGFIASRDGMGFPTTIEWLAPSSIWIDEAAGKGPMSAKYYQDGRHIPTEDLLHIRAFTVAGRVRGISPLKAFASLVSQGNYMTQYGNDWFAQGGFPPGIFRNINVEIDAEQAEEIKGNLSRSLRSRRPLVIGADWEYCCDAETEMLTARGWLRYDQIREGDLTLSLNTATGMSEWQPVQSVHIFDGPHDVTEMSSTTHSSVTTGAHRWPVVKRNTGKTGWTTTATMARDDRVWRAAPVQAPADAKWSDALVELVAWLWTEGHVRDNGMVEIEQSHVVNPLNVARIRAALTGLFGPAVETLRPCGHPQSARPAWREDQHDSLTRFRLNGAAGRELSAHAPGKVVSTAWLAELTRAQLELFVQVSIDADGYRRANGAARIGQRDRARLDAFQVACALAGYAGTVHQIARGANMGMWELEVGNRPWCKPAQPQYITRRSFTGVVWCPTTPHQNWFARRRGTTYFTGNTPVKVPPSEAQFVEATRLNATQIAAIYGVPPERIGGSRGDSLTYANQEQASISFVTDTLRPWLVRLENAFFGILPAKRYVRFNADAMVKTDLKTRHEVFLLDRQMGIRSTDEIRDIDDLAPLADGMGADTLPLVIAQDLVRSGKAIPSLYKDEITVLQVAPGATPGTPASQSQETPQADESSGNPPDVEDQAKAQALKAGQAKAANGQPKTTNAPVIHVGRSQPSDRLQPPGKAPKTRSLPVCSLDDVALLWAGQRGLDVAACRAEAGMHARRGGLEVRAYDAKMLDQGQYEWLLSMCRASENPVPCATLIPNGKRPGG